MYKLLTQPVMYQDLSSDSSLPKKQLVALEENEQRIRLALAKNLALAITKVRYCVSNREGSHMEHVINLM
jgi:hypothetical protein